VGRFESTGNRRDVLAVFDLYFPVGGLIPVGVCVPLGAPPSLPVMPLPDGAVVVPELL